MAKQFEFADFVEEFKVEFTIYEHDEGHYSDNGKWVEGEVTPVTVQGIILPLSDDDLRYVPNGTYTEADRKIYTTRPLKAGQKMEYGGRNYTIQNFKDYSAYADVFIYIARGVGE